MSVTALADKAEIAAAVLGDARRTLKRSFSRGSLARHGRSAVDAATMVTNSIRQVFSAG
ncbi:MAG: hypothetical protein U5L46_06435 [Agrobacterium sp.]|nr:hypothetical protein [Agrobacterium sp.]